MTSETSVYFRLGGIVRRCRPIQCIRTEMAGSGLIRPLSGVFRGGRGPAATALVGLTLAVLGLAITPPSHAQIILDGPNVTGNVGLTGEIFGSASVTFFWPGGSIQTQLLNGDTGFNVRVEPDQVIAASVSMSSFQGATNASVSHFVGNITGPLSTATDPLVLDLRRDAGRILGQVTVVGGTLSQLTVRAGKSLSSNESVSGSARTFVAPFDAILPFVAATGVSVSGTATVQANAGCLVPVALGAQSVDVPLNGSVDVQWTVDVSTEECDLASVTGTITTAGLEGQNSDVVPAATDIFLSGPTSRSQRITTGDFLFSDLLPGQYSIFQRDWFNAPYNRTDWRSTPRFDVGAGALVTQDLSRSVGTAHGVVLPVGTWGLSDASSVSTSVSSLGSAGSFLGSGSDRPDVLTGEVDYVVPVGTIQLSGFQPSFFNNNGARVESQSCNVFYSAPFPMEGVVNQGDRIDLGVFQPEASQADQVFQIANPAVGLTNLRLNGSGRELDDLGRQIVSKSIFLNSGAIDGAPQNSVSVLIRCTPGTYRMTATGQGDDGATYGAQFDLVLGAPANTPQGTDVINPIEIVDETTGETTTGSITFGTVTTGGETTVSASGSGPRASGGFRVFGGGSLLYYDIQSTADFDTATVCLTYDDMGLVVAREELLTLQHSVCLNPDTQTGCSWDDITLKVPGTDIYPDTVTNEICGVTDSFSIFALMLPLDEDEDGVIDAEDNCPAVPNTDQADFDGDGFGDVCDSDFDGDGVDDTADNCPLQPNPGQENIDGDDLGDICDPDVDGDLVFNELDNCPVNANEGQVDFDGDSLGDACDLDDDNDGIADGSDICAGTPPEVLITADGCSSDQFLELRCPSNGDYRNHGQYLKCVAQEAEAQTLIGLITEQEKGAIVATAAQSDIGKQ